MKSGLLKIPGICMMLMCIQSFGQIKYDMTVAKDGSGNYTIGIREQLIFPEIEYDKVLSVRGMNITITTSSKDDGGALELLTELGFPFK